MECRGDLFPSATVGFMPGLRIKHTDSRVRSCTLVIPAPRKPLHIHVDGEGGSEVSTGVWEDLELSRSQGVPHGFEIANVVEDPPELFIGLGVQSLLVPTKVYMGRDAVESVAPQGTIVKRKR